MQTLFVPKYGITYRVNPKDPCELQWSKKPFGPLTSWRHAYTFGKPIRALDTDDKTGQGVVVLNDSTTYVGSGVRVWGRKFYTAGSRIYSLYAIGESKEKKPMSKMKIRVHEATANSEKFKDLDAMCADVSEPAGIPGLDSIIRVDHLIRKDGETQYEPPFYLRLGKKWYAFDDRVYIDQPELCEYVNKVLDRYMLSNYKDIAPTPVREFKKCSSKVRSALFNLYSRVDNKYLTYRRAYLYKNQVYIELGMYWSDTIILKSSGSSKWQGDVLRCYGIAITGGNDEIIETERLTDNSDTHSMDNLINAIDSRMSNLPIVQGTLYDYGNFAQVGWWSTRNYRYDTIAPKVKALAQVWNTRIKDKYPDIADSLYVKTLNGDSSLYIKYLVPEEALEDLTSAFEPLAVDLQGSDPTYVKV